MYCRPHPEEPRPLARRLEGWPHGLPSTILRDAAPARGVRMRFFVRRRLAGVRMPDYIALIHKDDDGSYGVSFPDIPGIFTGGDSVEEAIEEATELLEFAADDWTNPDGSTGIK